MNSSTKRKESRKSKATFGKRAGSMAMSVIAVVFTLMPMVTIGIWTTQFYDFSDLFALGNEIMNAIPTDALGVE